MKTLSKQGVGHGDGCLCFGGSGFLGRVLPQYEGNYSALAEVSTRSALVKKFSVFYFLHSELSMYNMCYLADCRANIIL